MDTLSFSTTWPYPANTDTDTDTDTNAQVDVNAIEANVSTTLPLALNSSCYDPRPIIIDLRPNTSDNANEECIPGTFPFPVNQYAWRQQVPWFLFPDKSVPFDLVVPDLAPTPTPADYAAHYASLALDHTTHPWTTGPMPVAPLAAPKTAALILRHLVQGGWTIRTVLVATPSLLASIPPTSPAAAAPTCIRLPFEPSPVLIATARLIFPLPNPPARPLRICDLGCGAGRDLAYLLHTYPATHVAHATAVDNWKGSIERVAQVAAMLGFADRLHAVRAELKPLGVIKHFAGQAAAAPLDDERFDWVILHRFLPPRSFARRLHALVAPGGYILVCTFVLPSPDTTLGQWVQAHESPTSFSNLLVPGELARDMDGEGEIMAGRVSDAQVCASQRKVDKFGWGFNERNGYKVIKEEVVAIPDGRTVLWFLAQKVGVESGNKSDRE